MKEVLVDTSELHFSTWKKTSEEHGFKNLTLDDIRFASMHHEEFAKMMLAEIEQWTKKNSTDSIEHKEHPTTITNSLNLNNTENTDIVDKLMLEEIKPIMLE